VSNRKFDNQFCIYCGAPAASVDHIPPRSLFAKSNRNNLIRVPSCRSCNNGFSKDDEYWQWAFALREESAEHPDIEHIRLGVDRAISMPEKLGLVKALWRSMEVEIDKDTQSTIHTYTISDERITQFFTRLIKALYYHERGSRLPDDYQVLVFPEQFISGGQSVQSQTLEAFRKRVLSRPAKELGNGVFTYQSDFDIRFQNSAEDDSLWWLQFYGDVGILCLTQK